NRSPVLGAIRICLISGTRYSPISGKLGQERTLSKITIMSQTHFSFKCRTSRGSLTHYSHYSLFNPQPKARKQIVPIPAETSRIVAFGCGLNNERAIVASGVQGRTSQFPFFRKVGVIGLNFNERRTDRG
ncbi:MAG: hypothetical protein ACYC4U_33425, partial [Pirellulaceae bacterium]